jgi:hypothetical protein
MSSGKVTTAMHPLGLRGWQWGWRAGSQRRFRRWRNKYQCFQSGYGRVFTTNAFTQRYEPQSRTHTENSNVRESPGSNSLENVFKKSSGRIRLRKLG